MELGRDKEAARDLVEALRLAADINDRVQGAMVLLSLAALHSRGHRHAVALALDEAAGHLLRATGAETSEVNVQISLDVARDAQESLDATQVEQARHHGANLSMVEAADLSESVT